MKANVLLCRSAIAKMLAAAIILTVAVAIAGAAYYLTLPAPSLSPTQTPTRIPIPTPTPQPIPGPGPTPVFDIKVDLGSSEGFNLTKSDYGILHVLPPGGSGTISVTIDSASGEDWNLSLDIVLAGEWGVKFYGVQYSFSPTNIFLRAGGHGESILKIEADKDAPTAHYETSVMVYWDGTEAGVGVGGPDLLVAPYTPAYMYYVRIPTPGVPAPQPTPEPPEPPGDVLPSFELPAGGEITVLFYIINVLGALNLSVTAPPEIGFELLQDALDVVPGPGDMVYLLTVAASPNASEGTRKITVTGVTSSYTFERSFYLVVKST